MSDEVHATVRGSVEQFEKMIESMSLKGDVEHDDLYLNILEDEIRVLQSTPGESVISFGTFDQEYFDEIDLEKEVSRDETENNGNQIGFDVGAEAILEVDQTLEYLNYASSTGIVELTFSGSEKRRLSTMLRIEGALEAWINLPGAEMVLDKAPFWLPSRFDEENRFTSPEGSPAPTQIDTDIQQLDTIIDVVNGNPSIDHYPIVVEDGLFHINVGSEHMMGVRGELASKDIVGPDVANNYGDGFQEIMAVLDGGVQLQTGPGNNPLAVVSEEPGAVVRHVNGPVEV